MAQALRTVWLEPEEQQISSPISLQTPRNRQTNASTRRTSGLFLLRMVGAVVLVVCAVTGYIHIRARIAQFEFQRQAMTVRLHQLQVESAQLKLDIAGMDNASQIAQLAQQQNMAYPTADRVQYIQIAASLSSASTQQAAAPTPTRSWMGQAGHLLVSRLGNIAQRFGHAPGAPAYAQE